ncbi:MAG TPA: hypothetical protein DCS08_05375 [Candidatus Moranbacteria bacterium]|nr:hypothetical protein [Candidatus Moranbacteria bacterium]HBY11144.1 hypothetical protein [Candidatus Moranbacteria bacterium]
MSFYFARVGLNTEYKKYTTICLYMAVKKINKKQASRVCFLIGLFYFNSLVISSIFIILLSFSFLFLIFTPLENKI